MKIKIILLILCILLTPFKIDAKDHTYHLVDYDTNKNIKEINDYQKAVDLYDKEKQNYQNLVLLQDNQVIKMEYGTVHFKKDEKCAKTIDYQSEGKRGSFNVCELGDALYLKGNKEDGISYLINNIEAETSFKNVELVPFKGKVRPSIYTVEQSNLYHSIMMQSTNDLYSYKLYLGQANIDDGTYYSYDGHYFYDDFYKMSDDIRNNQRNKAINKDKYYNYYMYLPFRTMSNYSADDFNYYIEELLTYDGSLTSYHDYNHDGANDIINKSQLYNTSEAFIEYQNLYGVNALLALGIAKSESSYGKNYTSYRLNSLYSKMAFDNDEARSNGRYLRINDSIYAFSRYLISNRLSNTNTNVYAGSFIGDNLSGISVNYSQDPYFNEKVVSSIYEVDDKLANKDCNAYSYGITAKKDIDFYQDNKLSDYLFTVENERELSLVILKEDNKSFKVQLDDSDNKEDKYNFKKQVAYIDKEDIKKIINRDKIHESKYYNVTYKYEDQEKTISFKENVKASVLPFDVNKHAFINLEKEPNINKDDECTLEYELIESIEVIESKSNHLELAQPVDLTSFKLRIHYHNDKHEDIPITTDMIQKINPNKKGEQVIKLTYSGIDVEFKLFFDEQLAKNRQFIAKNLPPLVDNYRKDAQYDINIVNDLVAKLKTVDYDLNMDEIRVLDEILISHYRDDVNFKVEESIYDAKISGMAVSLDFKDSTTKNNIIKDTYRFDLKSVVLENDSELTKIGEGHGMTSEMGLSLAFYRNYEKIGSNIPFIVSLKLENMDPSKVYVVYYKDELGNVVKCLTTQTESYITFRAFKDGTYAIYSMDSLNEYQKDDYFENLDSTNDDNFFLEEVVDFSITNFMFIIDEILIVLYLVLYNRKERIWNDYKKSLLNAVSVQEEKRKS